MFNKRGQQEGIGLGTLLVLVVGVVAVVVIILFVTGAFDKLGGVGEALPGQLEAVAQACKIAVQGSLTTDFCYNFKDAGNDEFVNCQDARIDESLKKEDMSGKISCASAELLWNAKANTCAGLSPGDGADAFFNGNRTDKCAIYYNFTSSTTMPYQAPAPAA